MRRNNRKSLIERLLGRWFVSRERHEELHATLEVAYDLVVRHHAGVQVKSGCLCPVCCQPGGVAPEMDRIASALENLK